MVVDTSALLAILFDEPEAAALRRAVDGDAVRLISAASFVEASILMDARVGPAGVEALDLALREASIEVVPVDAPQAFAARAAYAVTREPLLFKGDDFARTGIRRVQFS